MLAQEKMSLEEQVRSKETELETAEKHKVDAHIALSTVQKIRLTASAARCSQERCTGGSTCTQDLETEMARVIKESEAIRAQLMAEMESLRTEHLEQQEQLRLEMQQQQQQQQ